jgi:hypothetical protein
MERKRKDTQLRDRLEALEELPAKTRKDLIGVLDALIEAYKIERVPEKKGSPCGLPFP